MNRLLKIFFMVAAMGATVSSFGAHLLLGASKAEKELVAIACFASA